MSQMDASGERSARVSLVGAALRPRFNRVEFGVVGLMLALACAALFRERARLDQVWAAAFASPLREVRLVEAAPVASAIYGQPYEFTTDWFSVHVPVWEKALGAYKGKPGVRYLEVGLYEGRSAFWMLENILTDPTARMVGVDLFDGELKARYLRNLELSGRAEQVETIVEPSQLAMRGMPLNSFDIIYIDGSHATPDVLEDAVLAYRLLKLGGTLIFDDYQWAGCLTPGKDTNDSERDFPKAAIDAFVTCFKDRLELIHNGDQLIVRKTL